MLHRQLHPHPAARLVQVAPLHVRVGPGEVDQLEDAQGGCRLGEPDGPRRLAGLEDDDLAGLDVADVLGADDVEARPSRTTGTSRRSRRRRSTARRRGRRAAAGQAAEDERPEAERVADADDPPLVEDDQAVGAADPRQDPQERLDRVGRRLVGEQRGQQLRVGRGRQPGATAGAAGSSSSRVLTRLPLWPIASARRGPSRYVGWAFSQTVDPVVE